ncbi:hypothetical protein LIER_43582 [Lithospermum erythrorhizon]|uniref:non-specific serine/threonine protein kinase n=1 Tax=Lithospermum erythrorhizon TaxID=34254 RepID=A0AAV3QF95_LITER
MYSKISRGEFRCPQWFPCDVKMLLTRLLDPNPCTRMTVSELMKNHWFGEGFKRYHGESPRSVIDFEKDWDESCVEVEHTPEGEPNAMIMKPTSLNAFDIISRSPSFDLSGLFEKDMNPENGTRFTIQKPASTIVCHLEMALMDRYKIKTKDGIVRLQSVKEGRRGQLAICAEIFEITPSLHVVEVMQSGGDALEYKQFCDQELRPSLKDMV